MNNRTLMTFSFRHTCYILLAGSLTTLAFAPFYFFPILAITFPILLSSVLQCHTLKHAFWIGWLFAFAHHVTGLYWIANSLLVDAKRFAWLIPFAVGLIPAYLALYTGLVTTIIYKSKLHGWRAILLLASLWTIAEILRAHLLTGFPWNSLGTTMAGWSMAQPLVAMIGVYGVSFMVIITISIPWLLVQHHWKASGVFIMIVGIIMTLSHITFPPSPDETQSFTLRLIQPNIPQTVKWDEAEAFKILDKHIMLSQSPFGNTPPDVIIWPESALPFRLEDDDNLRHYLAEQLPPDSHLILGGVRVRQKSAYNSVFVLNSSGDIEAIYDKHHLVPFGEYIPLRQWIPFVETITQGGFDFKMGAGADTLKVADIPLFSPLICYEVIFSGKVVERNTSPAWMVNVTNDAWFGNSTGPHQHYAMAIMRAWEENIPLVRVANTGISGVIAPQMNTSLLPTPLGIHQEGVIDITLEVAKHPEHYHTVYHRFGIILVMLICSFGFLIAFIGRK